MSVEAFVWPYENGEPSSFAFVDVLNAFGQSVVAWEPEFGCLHLELADPPDSCDVFCDKDAAETGRVRSLMVSRPVRHAGLWEAVLRLMSGSHSVLFFSDHTTPLFWDLRSVEHFPADLIAELGKPVCVRTPDDVMASHDGEA